MELIDRYVAEVGRHLPEKIRPDIEAEIRSLLEDNLEDRSRQEGRRPDEKMVVDVLKSYGKPEAVAATYLPPRYLVGPQMYPTFMMVVRLMLLVVMILSLVQFGFAATLGKGGLPHIGLSLLQAINTFISSSLTALGVIVIVFSMLQWKYPHRQKEEEDWDPRKLERVTPVAERIKPGSLIVETVFSVVVLLALIFYNDRIGLYMMINGQWEFAPVFTQAFYNLLPWIAGLWSLGIFLNLFVLRQGRWQPVTRWFSVGLTFLEIALLLIMLAGAPIVEVTPKGVDILQSLNIGLNAAGSLENGMVLMVRMILVILLIVESVDLCKTVYCLLLKKPVE